MVLLQDGGRTATFAETQVASGLLANIRSHMSIQTPNKLLLSRALKAGPDQAAALFGLFEALDWRDVAEQSFRVPGTSLAFEVRAAAQPRTVVLVGDNPDASRAASVSYSREAPYLVRWANDVIELHEARVWKERPGDSPVFRATVGQPETLVDLLELLERRDVLADVPGGLTTPGTRHPALPHRLAQSLAALRLQVADVHARVKTDPAGPDAALLAFFHQLLYVRVAEDRGSVRPPDAVKALLDGVDPADRLAGLLGWYERELDSDLFQPSGVRVQELPTDALLDLLRSLVEPWRELRLDFSVVQSELAGRLYESYLASVPVADEDERLRLFPAAKVLDRRDVQASFYTPPGLAKAIVERTLSSYVRGQDIDPFSIRVVDPACGSGAFLLAAFRWLRAYAENRLGRPVTSAEREKLLLSCIFGADVDERALALTRVQLLEEAEIIGRLPILTDNLLLGDALSSPPDADGANASTPSVPWSDVLEKRGPFSAVVGNPPFGSEAKLPRRLPVASIRRLDGLFPEIRGFGRDYAFAFGALALRLLAPDGAAGFVMPRKLLEGISGARLRTLLADRGVDWVADLRALGLFPGVKTRACIIVWNPRGDGETEVVSVADSREEPSRALDDLVANHGLRVSREQLKEAAPRGWSRFRLRWEGDLIHELTGDLEPLAPQGHDARDARFGTKPARVDQLVLPPSQWSAAGRGKLRIGDSVIAERYAPLLVYARDIRPFSLQETGRRLLLPFELDGQLTQNPAVLDELARRGGLPKNFQRGDLRTLLRPKVLLRALAREPAAVADVTGRHLPIMRGALAIRADDLPPGGLRALATLLNSALYQWLLRGMGAPLHDESVELSAADVRSLPVPRMTPDAIDALGEKAEDITAALHAAEPYRRAREYRLQRHKLDVLAFELAGATARLRSIVLEELIRES